MGSSIARNKNVKDSVGDKNKFAANLLKSIRLKDDICCSICLVDLVAPCKVSTFGCNSQHNFHVNCAHQWISHSKSKNMTPCCPLCRVPIDEAAI